MGSKTVRAVIVAEGISRRLVHADVTTRQKMPYEITVRVKAISLNRGEVRRAFKESPAGTRPGWDFAGIVEQASDAPNSPEIGRRVVGFVNGGAWVERLHIDVNSIAVIPDSIGFAQAVTLPAAGLTALAALRKGGLLLGQKVLIDGASGGVGSLAVQLAVASGADVYAHVRSDAHKPAIASVAANRIIVSEHLEDARRDQPFDLIIDSLGGRSLASALSMLAPGGTCVAIGASAHEPVTFDSTALFRASGSSLQSFLLPDEITPIRSARAGLTLLLNLIEEGKIVPTIGAEEDWTEINDVAQGLLDRQFTGKAVLTIS